MLPFDKSAYMPILWTRRGERRALAELSAVARAAVRPLFVVAPVEFDFDTEAPKRTIDEHLASLPADLQACWGEPALIDTRFLGDDPVGGSVHPLEWLVAESRLLGLELTPVVSLSSSAALLGAAASVVASSNDGQDLAFRLSLPLGEWPSQVGQPQIDALLTAVGCKPAAVHLILDLESDAGTAAQIATVSELTGLPYLNDWRSVVVAGASMPDPMPAGAGLHHVDRKEWVLYGFVRSPAHTLPRLPTFGDYAIAGTSPGADINPRFMNISATLRYTITDEWLVAKGGLWKGNGGKSLGGAAVPPAAQLLVSDSSFAGASHCDFDQWLVLVAAGGPGSNPEAWRRYGTQHHLQFVTEQIASLP